MYEDGEIEQKDIKIIAERETLKRETIQRKLKKLVEMGMVIKNSSLYSLSDVALTEIRLFDPLMGKKFGSNLLTSLLWEYFPRGKDLKERVKEIISVFGFYLLYSLIEACRPIDLQNDDKITENKTKDTITYRWFKNSLESAVILDSFISNLGRDYDYKDRNHCIEKYSHLIEKRTEGTFEALCLKRRALMPFNGGDSYNIHRLENNLQEENSRNENISASNYEISQERIDAIKHVMYELFPNYHMVAELGSNSLLDQNKESYFELMDRQVSNRKKKYRNT